MNDLNLVVLKALITNKKHALDFVSECDAKIFSPETWNFANLVTTYIRVNKDLPTLRILTEKLSKNNLKLADSIKKTWETIESIECDDKEYKHDLDTLKKRFAEKQILSIRDSLVKLDPGSMDITKTLGDMQKTMQNIKGLTQAKSFDRKTLKDALPSFVEKFNAKRLNPNIDIGLKTGYSFLDFATNGFKPADFILIAGESGFGKSLLLNNIAIQTWLQGNTIDQRKDFGPGKNIIYFSLEMPYDDCFNRLLSRLSGVPSRKIESANLEKEEFAKIKTVLDFINAYPYQFEIVDIADASANDLEQILLDVNYSIDAVFIDYLGIMKTNTNSEEQDWLKQGIVAYECRGIGRKYGLPIFSAVQLNRKNKSAKDASENIGLSRLARSGTIATHATTVIQIENRPGENSGYNDFVCHVIKNRKGTQGKFRLLKNLACATLLDIKIEEPDMTFEMKDQEDISEKLDLLK